MFFRGGLLGGAFEAGELSCVGLECPFGADFTGVFGDGVFLVVVGVFGAGFTRGLSHPVLELSFWT